MSFPMREDNLNLLGCKVLGKIFTKKELEEGYVEGQGKSTFKDLDPIRINLLKGKFFLNYL